MRRDGERGAAAVFAAVILVAVFAAAALAIDTGNSTIRVRHLQGIADRIALDAVRAVGDRFDPTGSAQAIAETFAMQAAARNDWDPSSPNGMQVQVGTVDWTTNTFTAAVPAGGSPNAVWVRLDAPVDHAFMPGTTNIYAEAVAGIDAHSALRVGSSVARFDAANTPLGPILGGLIGVNFTAADHSALLGASVLLSDLWFGPAGTPAGSGGLGFGSPDEAAEATVTVTDLFAATATALNADGSPSSLAAAGVLGSVSGSITPSLTFAFQDIVDTRFGTAAGLAGARINVLQLVSAAAMAANKNNLIDVDLCTPNGVGGCDGPAQIPGVKRVRMRMGVIEAPKVAIGPARQNAAGQWVTRATTAQVRVRLDLDLNQTVTVLGQSLPISLPLYLESGGATAEMTSLDCQIPESSSPVTIHARTRAGRAAVGEVNSASLTIQNPGAMPEDPFGDDTFEPVTVLPGKVVNAPTLVTVTASAATTISPSEADLSFTGPFDQPGVPPSRPTQSVGANTLTLSELSSGLTLSVTTAPGVLLTTLAKTALTTSVRAALTPVLAALPAQVDALASTPLGMTFGGADVTNLAFNESRDLNCAIRRLAA